MFLQALGLGFTLQFSAMKSLSLGFRSVFVSHRNVRAYMYPTQTKDVSKAILAAISGFSLRGRNRCSPAVPRRAQLGRCGHSYATKKLRLLRFSQKQKKSLTYFLSRIQKRKKRLQNQRLNKQRHKVDGHGKTAKGLRRRRRRPGLPGSGFRA